MQEEQYTQGKHANASRIPAPAPASAPDPVSRRAASPYQPRHAAPRQVSSPENAALAEAPAGRSEQTATLPRSAAQPRTGTAASSQTTAQPQHGATTSASGSSATQALALYQGKHAAIEAAPPESQPGNAEPTDEHHVARNTAWMSVATLGSRITGLLRTWVMAFALGNTLITSAYQVANNMPNVIYDFVAGGMLGAAFIPVYLLQKERLGKAGSQEFASNILNLMCIILGVLSLAAAIFAPQVIATQTFTVADTALVNQQAIFFFRIFAIQILFYGIGGVINGILNAERVYFLPALAPAMNNIIVIVTFLAYIPLNSTNATLANTVLAAGTTLGVAVQALVQIPALRRTGYRWKPVLNIHDPALIEALRIAIPTFLYIIGSLVAYSCRNAFSLWTGDEGPSVLAYAWMWFQLPYGVLAVSLSSTMFTEMSEDCAKGDLNSLRSHISTGINITLLMITPLAALMGVFSDSIMQLFQAGKFSAEDVTQVASVLRLWVIGLPLYSVWMYLYKVFASMRKFLRFAVLNCCFVVIQCVGYAVLCPADALGLAGVPISDVVFYTLGCIATLIMLSRMIGALDFRAIAWRFVRILGASAVGVALAWALLKYLPFGEGGMLTGLAELLVYGTLSLMVIFALCQVLRIPEMDRVHALVKRLLKR